MDEDESLVVAIQLPHCFSYGLKFLTPCEALALCSCQNIANANFSHGIISFK